MNYIPPFARQLLVASSPQLAALSVGGLIGYPAVLLNQLKTNDSSIALDLNKSSWIASIHGLAGIPSILIPTIMQWQGRRFAFIAACLSILIGWILTYCATDFTTILIGESFHGFGGNSLIVVSLITISEMVDPNLRSTSMLLLNISQTIGIVIVTFAGYFLHWQTVSIVLGVPIFVALLLVFFWPESPSWLACKGEFKKCEKAFFVLRGTGNEATKELTELLRAQKESLRQLALQKMSKESVFQDVWFKVTSRDFIEPILYLILIMFTFYFGGFFVVFTYAVDIVANTTNNSDYICFIYIDFVYIIASIFSIILLKYFENKTIMLASLFGSGTFLVLASILMFCKDLNVIPKSALLVCVLGYLFCCVFGSFYLTFIISTELIPVKHRGLGGALYIFVSCMFHSMSLKISPYLFEIIEISGTLMLFGIINFSGLLLIRKFVPETKGKTLQEIEDFYNIDFEHFVDDKIGDDFEITVVNDDIIE